MGVATVVVSMLMCFIFNMILPSKDVYSDVYLFINVITFNLGDSIELSGCKVCHGVSEDELYAETTSCDVCMTSKSNTCGGYPSILKKMIDIQNKEECGDDTYRVTSQNGFKNESSEFKNGACQKGDSCCLQSFKTKVNDINGQKLDPRLYFECFSLPSDFNYCYVTGKTSVYYCASVQMSDSTFLNQVTKLIDSDVFFGGKDQLKNHFFTYEKVNESSVRFIKNFTIMENKCGVYFQPKLKNQALNRRCNEHACQLHLQYLHRSSNIYNLELWKNTTDFIGGIKYGGPICFLLRTYGWFILVPILINTSFTLVVFKNDLETGKANKFEIIPLLLLCYPQYKTLKFLLMYVFCHRDEAVLNRDKEEHDRDLSSLEPFLESCLQVSFLSVVSYYFIYRPKIFIIKSYKHKSK